MKTILVVDDNKTVVNTLTSKLKQKGFKVLSANSLFETEEILNHKRHLIFAAILDLNLPDAPDGEIVDFVLASKIPSVVLTGMFSQEIFEKMTEKNIIDYVLKSKEEDFDYAVNLIKNISTYHKRKALIVDDSTLSLKILTHHTALLQFDILTARDGVEGLEILKKYPNEIDLIIVDYNMPKMDGFEFLLEVRKKYKKDEIIVIGETAYDSKAVSAKFLKYGANAYLTKPFTKDEFNYIVNNAFELVLEKKANKSYLKTIDTSVISFTLEEDFHFSSSSSAFLEFSGYSSKELTSNIIFTIFGKNFLKVASQAQKDGSWSGELLGKTKDKETVWLEGTLTSSFDNEGNISQFTGIFADITNKKQLLENEKLLLSQTKFDAMSTLLYQISHHWRQPLASLSLSIQDIIQESKDLENCGGSCYFNNGELLENTDRDIKVLEDLSENIEFFAKYISNDFKHLDIKSDYFILELQGIVKPLVESLNIKMEFTDKITTTFNIYREVIQVIINLIQNAIDALIKKAIPNPKISIKIFNDESCFYIELTDNAGGVEDIEKIFEPYFSTKQSLNNTGLGLYISAIIVEKHLGGAIKAKNKDNGLLYTISIPINY